MSGAGDEIRVHPIGVFEQQGESEEDIRPPVLLLRDDMGREVRIPIGSCEGLAIQFALTQQHVPRPLTHDLALQLLAKLSSKLEHVVIDSYSEEGGCHATLELTTSEGPRAFEARAGDGVALALRADLPVFITEDVFIRAGGSG